MVWRQIALGIGMFVVLLILVLIGLIYIQPPAFLAQIPGAIFLSEADWRSGQKRIAITFDDGPDPDTTPQILQVLAEYQIPATFFLIGERALQHPEIVQQIATSGHGIGNHSLVEEFSAFRGDYGSKLSQTEAIFRQILGEQFTGSRWVRPGGGIYTPTLLSIVRSNPQYQGVVLGSIFPFDTHIRSVDFASKFILDRVHPGAIVVLHDAKGKREATADQPRGVRAAQTLRRIVPPLETQGYQFVTLDQLLSS